MRHLLLVLLAALCVPLSNAPDTGIHGEARGEARREVALTFDDLPEAFSRDTRRNGTGYKVEVSGPVKMPVWSLLTPLDLSTE